MKRIAIFAFFALVATAAAEDGRSGMEDTVRGIIEGMRKKLAEEGVPELGVPPLDPLNVTEKAVRVDIQNIADLRMLFRDVTGRNILGFNVTNLKVSMLPMAFKIRLDWEPISVKGYYNVNGNVINVIPVYGNGSFRGDISGSYFSLGVELEMRGEELRVRKFELDFGLANATIVIENLLGGVLGDIICQLLTENLPTMVEQFKIGYLKYVSDFMVGGINGFLEGKTIDDIIDFIFGLAPELMSQTPFPSLVQGA